MIMRKKSFLVLSFLILLFATTFAQVSSVTVAGVIKDKQRNFPLSFVNVVLLAAKDSAFVTGTVTGEDGRFALDNVRPGNYILEVSYIGYITGRQPVFVGSLSAFLDLATVDLEENVKTLGDVTVTARRVNTDEKLEKKTYAVEDNISQGGGSVLQAMQNLPGVTVQDGKVQLRGNDKITVLVDGKQTALTGFNSQSGLDNLPASSIEKIEIINNPSSKYDANGNAGIINIVMKKNNQDGFSGKAGLIAGLGALWVKKENLPGIRPQYRMTPKINPSLSLNYRRRRINAFVQADNLYTHTLNKNEFVTRTYNDGTVINQQTKRNRNTNFFTSKAGMDWHMDEQNTLTLSGLFGSEKILDRGDEPFFNANLTERQRLWQFLEDELKTTAMGSAAFQHKFKQPGHLLNAGFNYTFHREDEKYYFDNILPAYTGKDAFKLISDEHVADFNVDYVRPLKYGRIEGGVKFRYRKIPTNMQFIPGLNSPLDTNAGGLATYKETIPALYGNYNFENEKYEAEVGLRVEYVSVRYDVDPRHPVYHSDGYHYTQPFPTLRLAYKINERNKLMVFYNRRVDRPNEVDIRVFPKYDDAEIIKVGNPALLPQFTNSFEMGYRTSWNAGYFYAAAYHRFADGTITRISTTVPNSTLIYAIFQNAGRSYNTGLEGIFNQAVTKWYTANLNANIYRNQINAFTVENLYPVPHTFSTDKQTMVSGNIKLNNMLHLPKGFDLQLSAVYLAPDIIPQGTIGARFSLDMGIKKSIQHGKGELILNATDLLNTMVIKKNITGNGFNYISSDYYETQVVRVGYNYKF